ncbi:NCS2 family permease [Candidatus Micrarchaeota archaeon]|nr:NCS2 family permease [Candidatus Micrarchaeota archaeon]
MKLLDQLSKKISEYFEFTSHSTSFTTEILAGISTFLALSYIFVVNPSILGEGGFNKSAVLFATIIASASMTILMGIWAKKPLVLAPGMEMNAYVAFYVINQLGFTWQAALGAVFWSGILCLILTLSTIRISIINAIPNKMKAALSLCVGVFLCLIALKITNVLSYNGVQLAGLGILFSPTAYVLYFGTAVILILSKFKIRGAVLISIILSTIFANFVGLGTTSADKITISADMLSAINQLDLSVIFDPKMLNVILVLFLVDFYGSVAKFIGLTRNTSIVDKDGTFPKMKEALTVDSIGTVLGSLLGTTSIITYVESKVGIGEGGRTGLTAVVCGLLMLGFIALSPLVSLVPVVATTGALIFVGITLLPSKDELKAYSKVELITVLLMVATVIYTFAIDKALLIGFLGYIGGLVFSGRAKEVDKYMILSTILLLIGTIIQLL